MGNSDKSAFARPSSEEESYEGSKASKIRGSQNGLTKREYFAGLAMQGLLSGHAIEKYSSGVNTVAKFAIEYADELLKQLGE